MQNPQMFNSKISQIGFIYPILDSINQEIIITDTLGQIEYLNLRARTNLFSETKELKNIKEIFATLINKYELVDANELNLLLEKTFLPENFIGKTFKIKLLKTTLCHYMVTTSPVYDSENGHLGRIWIFTNITAEEKINDLRSEYISLASHQLKSPAANLRGFLATMLDGGFGNVSPYFLEPLTIATKSAEQLTELVNSLLNIDVFESGNLVSSLELTNVVSFLADFVEILKSTILPLPNIQFINQTDQTESFILIDSLLIKQLLTNLLDNSIKYSPPNSQIDLILVQCHPNLIIMVKDRGKGIPKNQQEQIFQKFFRADNTRLEINGSGLGLYYVKKALSEMGGNISFESIQNQGTTFTIEIPLATNT